MGTEIPRLVQDDHGDRFLTPADAAKRAFISQDQLLAQLDLELRGDPTLATESPELRAQLSGPGRRPKQLISERFVERLREKRLDEFGVREEIEALTIEVANTRSTWDADVANLKGRVDQLERALQQMIAGSRDRASMTTSQLAWEHSYLTTIETSLGLQRSDAELPDDG